MFDKSNKIIDFIEIYAIMFVLKEKRKILTLSKYSTKRQKVLSKNSNFLYMVSSKYAQTH